MLRLNRTYKTSVLFLFLCSISLFGQQELREGIRYFENKQWEKAIIFFSNLVEKNPSPSVYQYLGTSYIEYKKLKQGYNTYLEGVNKYPADKTLLHNLLSAGLQLKIFDEPISKASEYLKKNPSDEDIKILISQLYLTQAADYHKEKKYEKVLEASALAGRYNSKSEDVPLSAIYAYLMMNKNKEARTEAERAIVRFPNSVRLNQAYLTTLINDNEYQKALETALKIKNNFKNDVDFQIQLGMLYRANYKTTEASAHFDKLIATFPNNEKVYNGAISYYESVGMYDNVRILYEKKIKVFKREKEFREKIAESYEQENKSPQAREVYIAYLKKKEDTAVRTKLAKSYMESGLPDSAIYHFNIVLAVDKNNYEAFRSLYKIYDNKKSYDSLLNVAKVFLNYYGKDFLAHYYLAKAYFLNRDYTSARLYAESAEKTDRKEPYPNEILGDIFLLRGEKEYAYPEIKKCLSKSLVMAEDIQNKLKTLIQTETSKGNAAGNQTARETGEKLKDITRLISKSIQNLKTINTGESFFGVLSLYISQFPKNPLLLLAGGDYFKDNKNSDSAKYYYIKALNINPNLKEGHNGLAVIYEQNGDTAEAIRSYKRIIAIDKNDENGYDELIRLYTASGSLNELADEWLKIYKTDRNNTVLRERLIEVLHKNNRFDEAKSLILDKKE